MNRHAEKSTPYQTCIHASSRTSQQSPFVLIQQRAPAFGSGFASFLPVRSYKEELIGGRRGSLVFPFVGRGVGRRGAFKALHRSRVDGSLCHDLFQEFFLSRILIDQPIAVKFYVKAEKERQPSFEERGERKIGVCEAGRPLGRRKDPFSLTVN